MSEREVDDEVNMKSAKRILLLIGLCVLGGNVLAEPDWTVDWFSIDGGGGVSQGGGYNVVGITGHPIAGYSSAGNYGVEGGVWSGIVGEEPLQPSLSITRLGTSVVISWPSSATGYVLQQSEVGLGLWSMYGGVVADDGTNKTVTINPATGERFFRLSR